MGDLLADLRAAVAPYPCVRGPNPQEGGAAAVIRVNGTVEVAVELAASGRASASAASPAAAPLYIDLDLDALGAIRTRTSDPGFAAALTATSDGRLRRALANGGAARLGFGRWTLVRPRAGVAIRELAETVALLADRPAAIARDWREAARALGASWSGTWSARGDAGFRIATTRGPVELVHRLGGDGEPRLRTEAIGPGGGVAWRAGLVVDPEALAALIGEVVGERPSVAARPARSTAVAPMPFADWPAARDRLADTAVPDRRWTVRPTAGADPVRGLEEELVLDGVAVHTSCDARAVTRVRAPAPGADGLAIAARPGYRFLLGWLWPDPRLGDRAFDDRYVLEAEDLAWTRWWLGPTEREAIAATFAPEAAHPFAFALTGGEVGFHAAALPSRASLDAARQAAAFLSARGARAAAEWRALAGPLGATVLGDGFARDGSFGLRTGRGAVAIELAPITGSDGRLATRAQVIGGERRGPHLALRGDRAPDRLVAARGDRDASVRAPAGHSARASDAAWAETRIAAIAPALTAARPDLVELDGDSAAVLWSGPMLEPARLTAGLDLLARAVRDVAARPAPYR